MSMMNINIHLQVCTSNQSKRGKPEGNLIRENPWQHHIIRLSLETYSKNKVQNEPLLAKVVPGQAIRLIHQLISNKTA